jgi:cell division transport system permease protein
VQVDTAWVKRFHAMLDAARRLVAVISALLTAGIVLIIGNTVRLDILNRRTEIEVMKLVGGSDGFARRPFLYSGFLYGLGGGGMALLLAAVTTRLLTGAIRHLAETYGSDFGLNGVGWILSAEVLLGAGLLGWLGAWLAATWHIRAIEPS